MFHERTEEALTIFVVPIIFMSLIFVVFVVVPGTYAKIDAEGIDHFTIRSSLLHNKNCLAYENGAVYPGIVDINKFNPEKLQKCLGVKWDSYGVILNIKYEDVNKVIFVNERMTDRTNFCLSKGSFKCSSESVYVLVNVKNEKRNSAISNVCIWIVNLSSNSSCCHASFFYN